MITLLPETRMRSGFALALLFAAAACSGAEPIAPGSSVITVRLRDDRGAAAGRNPVIVSLSPTLVGRAHSEHRSWCELGRGRRVHTVSRELALRSVDPAVKISGRLVGFA